MMKFTVSLVFAGALLVLGANAQTPPDIQRSTRSDARTQAPPAPVIAPLGAGTTFNASLDDTLDTRKSKAGDVVTAETAEDVSYEQCLIFPKGTQIVGHIVRVTSGGRGRGGSAIFVQFDKAMMKDGQEVTLNAGIQALAAAGVAPTPSDAASKSLDAAARQVPVQESSTGTAATSEPLVVSTIYETPRTTLRPPLAGPLVAEGEFTSDGLFTPGSKGAFGRPDLKVYTPTSEGSHGTVLLSAKKNMHLDGGTHLLLVVQPPPTAGEPDAAAGPLDLDPNQ
jgi:hypothetical protein